MYDWKCSKVMGPSKACEQFITFITVVIVQHRLCGKTPTLFYFEELFRNSYSQFIYTFIGQSFTHRSINQSDQVNPIGRIKVVSTSNLSRYLKINVSNDQTDMVYLRCRALNV